MATTKFKGKVNATEGFLVNGVPLSLPAGSAAAVNVTAATLTVTAATHAGKVVTLNRAAGIAVTLPAATGSGNTYRFYLGTAVTSNATTIAVANSSDTYAGWVLTMLAAGGAPFGETATGTDDTLSMNGTTTGGLVGSYIIFTDMAANVWLIQAHLAGSGTLASSLSATV